MDNAKVEALTKALKDEDPAVRRAALETLETVPEAKAAIPALMEALKDEDNSIRILAVEALLEIDEEFQEVPAIDVMKTLIEVSISNNSEEAEKTNLTDVERYDSEDDSCTVAESANFIIADIAGYASAAAPDLINMLKDVDADYRHSIAYVLSFMQPLESSLVLEALRNENAQVRLGVIEALTSTMWDEELYQDMKAIVLALKEALEDESQEVREAASEALKEIDSYHKK